MLTPRGYIRTVYSADEIDAVAAYSPDTDSCYLIPIEDVAGRSYISLRLEPPLNNQAAKLNWADRYLFGAVAQLEERRHGMAEAAGSSPASSIAHPHEGVPAGASGDGSSAGERNARRIGARLAAERKRRGLSQRAVSRRTGIVPSVLSRLELGVGDPRVSIVERYAAGLGYAVQYHLIPSDQADRKPAVVLADEVTTKRLRLG